MLSPALLISAALASPYGELRATADSEQRLLPGDTAVLVGLAGELGCVASHDPVDCAALAEEPQTGDPLVELVPVPAMVLPPVGDRPASVMLPRFPYGLGEPVTPLLGPLFVEHSQASWVRVPLPADTAARFGAGRAQLLLEPAEPGPVVQPFVEPPGPPEVEVLDLDVQADAWPLQLMPYTRTQVLLPTRLVALRVEDAQGVLVDLAWAEEEPPVTGQPLVEASWNPVAEQALATATGLCMRAYYASSLRRPRREPPVLPGDIRPPRLAVLTDPLGQVAWAVPLGPPWDQPEPSACLRANARLLPAAAVGSSLAVLRLGPRSAQPPDQP